MKVQRYPLTLQMPYKSSFMNTDKVIIQPLMRPLNWMQNNPRPTF